VADRLQACASKEACIEPSPIAKIFALNDRSCL
jgi:hypothetical protein